ncbi:MAG: DNA polymerase III subunit alpha [Deltaproteobacteria bacterium]|nr:MAG: DNA polymerase III subunit alpha [Deltaproteobacteria bacterium]
MATDRTGDLAGRSDFAHLHLHTQYSLLDGAIRTSDLCRVVHERGMKAVAVTDHGNMFGAIQFYQEAKKWGVKPIFGCEAYLAGGDAEDRGNVPENRRNYHIVLLAKNEVGYRNLQRLVSEAYIHGFYRKPRVDRKRLHRYREGIVALSACLSGHVSRAVLDDRMDEARRLVRTYAEVFEPGHYFLELQPNGLPEQEKVNEALAELSRDTGVPIVATNDCHYVDRREAKAHEILMCMGMRVRYDDPDRPRHECDEFFVKTPEEMETYFRRYPEALENAARIATMCNVELELGRPELPHFELPEGEGEDAAAYLRKVARAGLERRLEEIRAQGRSVDADAYFARLEYELDIIVRMDFPGYFLIVWDFIRHAKARGIPVGPGRGSGAGSLVAYALRITDLDPIAYNLLFERFLNPERVSMPDFDIDFCMDRRDEVIEYVAERYGRNRVGQIATFHSLKARGLLRDVCRVLGLSVAEANELAKLVPEGPKVTLSACMQDPKEIERKIAKDKSLEGKLRDALQIARGAAKLRARAEADPKVREVLDVGCALEGLNRHAGMHAAGIVIGRHDLWEHVPCFTADGKLVTQYTMTDVEKAGLVKFDFLGLKTLTVISTAVRLVNEGGLTDEPFDIAKIPMDDPGVFQMISRGDTTGVFQLESSGFRDLLKRLQPDCFEDIIAAVALYRPGPLEGGMVDQFIECKHGRRAIEYPHPLLADVLRETYGVFVYQEQVMQAAQVLAGFSLGEADIMRRAMGKKKKAEMDRQRAKFVEGCKEHRGIDAKTAGRIFDLIDKFAGYGFNKSHSAAYGLITYQTAYLKHHFPVAFMAALMTCDKDKNENVVKFIAEARAMGIEVRRPCVNVSRRDFSVEKTESGGQAIRFGLGAVRNVGEGAVEAILAAREEGGPFSSLFDLCRRVDLKKVNRRTLEALIAAGAFDEVIPGGHRAAAMASLDRAVAEGQAVQRGRVAGQASLFDVADEADVYDDRYEDAEPWPAKKALLAEREALGFYLTGHPLDRVAADVDRFATCPSCDLRPDMDGRTVKLAGVVCDLRQVQTRSGRGAMAFFQLEDQFGRVEAVVFPKVLARVDEDTQESFGDFLQQVADDPILVEGRLEVETDDDGAARGYKILVERAQRMDAVRRANTRTVLLDLSTDELSAEKVLALKHLVADHRGTCTMELRVRKPGEFRSKVTFGDRFRISPDDATIAALERLFHPGAVQLV